MTEPSFANAIDVAGLRHAFASHLALASVTFRVPRGTIHCFVGPNGAGKTTTLKALATLLVPDQGSVEVCGLDARRHANEVRRHIGWMPDHVAGYRRMTVGEYLDFFAAAYGQTPIQRERTIGQVLELTDMAPRRKDLLAGLSRGMQQRVALARVLVHDPHLLLLDEPASGLDPRARVELMDILGELRGMGKTVFISSHILSELAEVCDGVTILDRGTVRYSGTMSDLLRRPGADGGEAVEVVLAEPAPALAEALRAVAGVRAVESDAQRPGHLTVSFDPTQCSHEAVVGAILAGGGKLRELRPAVRRLDEAFLALTTPGVRS